LWGGRSGGGGGLTLDARPWEGNGVARRSGVARRAGCEGGDGTLGSWRCVSQMGCFCSDIRKRSQGKSRLQFILVGI
jgi:hypothetical protein